MIGMKKMMSLFFISIASHLHFVGSSQLEIKNTEGGLNNIVRSSNEDVLVPSFPLKDESQTIPFNSIKSPDGTEIKKNYNKLSSNDDTERKLSHSIKMTFLLPTEPDSKTDPKLKGLSKEYVININDNSDKLNDKTNMEPIQNKNKINNEARIKQIQNKYEAIAEPFHYRNSTIEEIQSKDKIKNEARNEQIYEDENDEASIELINSKENRNDDASIEPIESKNKNKGIPVTVTPLEIVIMTDIIKDGDKKEAIITPSASENSTDIHRITRRAAARHASKCSDSGESSGGCSSSESSISMRSSSSSESKKKKLRKCEIPRHLAHSELRCVEYPQHTVCQQKCAKGYGHKNGDGGRKGMMHQCKVKKDKWHPSKTIDDCVPKVNCDIKLHQGKAKCFYNHMKNRPYCHINCDATDKDEEVEHLKKYKCSAQSDGKPQWAPKLPHCAVAVHEL